MVLAQGQLKTIFAKFNLALGSRTTACGVILAVFFCRTRIWTRFVAEQMISEHKKKTEDAFLAVKEVNCCLVSVWGGVCRDSRFPEV